MTTMNHFYDMLISKQDKEMQYAEDNSDKERA